MTASPASAVLFVTLKPAWGGSQSALLELLEALNGGVERWVAAPAGPFLEEIERRGAAERTIRVPGTSRNRLARYATQLLWLLCYVATSRFYVDVVHLNGPAAWRLGGFATWAARLPAVAWVHEAQSSPIRRRTDWVFRPFVRRIRWVAVSPVAADFLARSGMARREEIAIVPNPIEPRRLGGGPTEGVAGRLRVCYLSDSDTNKGFRLLPSVIRLTQTLPVEWHLYVNERADGTNADVWGELRLFEPGSVNLHKPSYDVSSIYAECDVVFVPSYVESFGRIVAEAMTLGIPVVASDIPAFRWVAGERCAALLFQVGDPESAATMIQRLVDDEILRVRLKEVARDRARAFDPSGVAALVLEQYRRALGG